jgi:GR25 family glycosyltransferase involved in LPS biosynthesis
MRGLPPTYVINMDRSADRWRAVAAECEREGVRATRLRAVDGSRLSPRDARRVTPSCRHLCTPGTIGCALSHMKAWDLVARRRHGLALVMEDDVRLVPGFAERVRGVLADMPADADVLLLGCGGLCSSSPYSAMEVAQKGLVSVTVPFLLRKYQKTTSAGPHRIFVPELFTGTHCYVVTRRGAAKLRKLHPRAWFHVDIAMGSLGSLNVYATDPALAFQSAEDSTIANFHFPKTLNSLLARVKTEKNGTLAYSMSVPLVRVAGVDVNLWLFAFAALGRWPRMDAYVLALFLTELVLGGGPSANLAGCALVWALSRRARR